jgi:hypothetical protein
MNKILILIFLTANFSFAQNNTQTLQNNKSVFNKLGEFIIDKTTIEIIKSLEEKYNTTSEIINDAKTDTYFRLGNNEDNSVKIAQIIENEQNISESPIGAPKCSKAKLFYVKGLKISDVEIINLKLRFYDDTLSSIRCDITQELLDIIRLKYGKGVVELKKEFDCQKIINGKKVTKFTINKTEVWNNEYLSSAEINYVKYGCIENYELYYLEILSYDRNLNSFMNCEFDTEKEREKKRISEF